MTMESIIPTNRERDDAAEHFQLGCATRFEVSIPLAATNETVPDSCPATERLNLDRAGYNRLQRVVQRGTGSKRSKFDFRSKTATENRSVRCRAPGLIRRTDPTWESPKTCEWPEST